MEYLFTEENLKKILTAPPRPAGAGDECPVCARISAVAGKYRTDAGESRYLLPAGSSRLEEFILVKNSWHILRCPACGKLYTDEYRYDHLVGGREDECMITGIGYDDALELLKGIKAKKLVKAGTTWIVSF